MGLTGDVAQILVCWWNEELTKRLRERCMGVLLYKRLVDDINIVLRTREGGEDGLEPMDKQNMDFVQEEANNILQSVHKSELY